MELVRLTHENLEREHICCAISNNKDIQVSSKKAWLAERLDEGLVFLKGNVRGKCFIEYIPAEYAWAPVDAPEYMYIDCLWVSGQFKGHGYSTELLDECIRDSREKGKKGLAVISSKKKKGFLSDPKYLGYKGFRLADSADPYFELWDLPFSDGEAAISLLRKRSSCDAERLLRHLYIAMSVYRKVCAAFEGSCTGKGRFVYRCPFRRQGRGAERPVPVYRICAVLRRKVHHARDSVR